jgi:serine protease inhibitor
MRTPYWQRIICLCHCYCTTPAIAGIGTPAHLELLRVLTAPDLQEHRAPTLSSPVNASAAEIHYNKYINSLTRSLRRHTNKTGTALLLANAIWSKKGPGGNTLFKPWYVRRVQGWFRAPSATVDDVAPLNAWAANVTHGLITEAVPRDLRFLLVLTNAVYFNGQWQYVFDKNLTEKAAFTTSSGVKEVSRIADCRKGATDSVLCRSVGTANDFDDELQY